MALHLSLLALGATAFPASAQKVTLRWKYAPGMDLVYRVTNQQEMDMGAMGGTMGSEQVQTMRWHVAEVAPNGDATVTITTERVQLDMQSVAGRVRYDSQTDSLPTDPQAKIFGAMVGLGYTLVIGPDGVVKSAAGLDELRSKVFAAMPPEAAAMMQGVGEQMFSEESMARSMQQSVQLFPEQPVGPGDTWHHSTSMDAPMIGTVTTNLDFTLAGIEQRDGRSIAGISSTGEMVMGGERAGQLPTMVELGTTRMSGSIDFDVDRGITLSSSTSMYMQMKVTAGAEAMTLGMTQTARVELVEYAAGR